MDFDGLAPCFQKLLAHVQESYFFRDGAVFQTPRMQRLMITLWYPIPAWKPRENRDRMRQRYLYQTMHMNIWCIIENISGIVMEWILLSPSVWPWQCLSAVASWCSSSTCTAQPIHIKKCTLNIYMHVTIATYTVSQIQRGYPAWPLGSVETGSSHSLLRLDVGFLPQRSKPSDSRGMGWWLKLKNQTVIILTVHIYK